MVIGIYRIINLENDKIYIGSTSNFKKRCYRHKGKLRNNKHENKFLQDDWIEHGEDKFIFEISQLCNLSKLRELEEKFIYFFKPEYNIHRKPNVLWIPTKEFREKARLKNLGKKHNSETKKKCALTFKGKHHTEETKQMMRERALKRPGRKKTEEEKEKIRLKMKGVKKSSIAHSNMCLSWNSEERRKKSSERMKKRMDLKYPKIEKVF